MGRSEGAEIQHCEAKGRKRIKNRNASPVCWHFYVSPMSSPNAIFLWTVYEDDICLQI